jgi:integrase
MQTKAARLPEIRFHDLRHSCISWLIAMKVPPTVVQSIVGHSTVLLTLDVYTHSSTERQEEAMDKMGEVFD